MTASRETPGERGTHFPTAYWPQWKCRASFYASASLPSVPHSSLFAVLGFVFHGDMVVLANIKDRGYCIPSGKIEDGEQPLAAMIREAYEETGVRLDPALAKPIGWYTLVSSDHEAAQRICPVFLAEADSFFEIPQGSESMGIRLTALEDVSKYYFFWDELMAAVFAYADRMRTEKL